MGVLLMDEETEVAVKHCGCGEELENNSELCDYCQRQAETDLAWIEYNRNSVVACGSYRGED